ncbi:MAG TPA: hypothetical protein HA224_00375 [Nanoarchaeota archaeon]|nr:hypothetical protein [Nanoarchaeota archaeon]
MNAEQHTTKDECWVIQANKHFPNIPGAVSITSQASAGGCVVARHYLVYEKYNYLLVADGISNVLRASALALDEEQLLIGSPNRFPTRGAALEFIIANAITVKELEGCLFNASDEVNKLK